VDRPFSLFTIMSDSVFDLTHNEVIQIYHSSMLSSILNLIFSRSYMLVIFGVIIGLLLSAIQILLERSYSMELSGQIVQTVYFVVILVFFVMTVFVTTIRSLVKSNKKLMKKMHSVLEEKINKIAEKYEDAEFVDDLREKNNRENNSDKITPSIFWNKPITYASLCLWFLYIGISWVREPMWSLVIGICGVIFVLAVSMSGEHSGKFFDLGYMLFYCMILLPMPIVMAPVLIRMVENGRKQSLGDDTIISISASLILAFSETLTHWIVRHMCAPYIYPRFIFFMQCFHYGFWYRVFGITELGVKFFIMMLLMNIHFVVYRTFSYNTIFPNVFEKIEYLKKNCKHWFPESDESELSILEESDRPLYRSLSKTTSMIYSIKLSSQEWLADLINMVAVTCIMLIRKNNEVYFNTEHIFIRLGIMVGSRVLTSILLKYAFRWHMNNIQTDLVTISSTNQLEHRLFPPEESITRRNIRKAILLTMKEKKVPVHMHSMYSTLFVRDYSEEISDLTNDSYSGYNVIISQNFIYSWLFFFVVSIYVIFCVFQDVHGIGRDSFYVE
jgi:hypothetical protein